MTSETPTSPEALRAEIAQTRTGLGDTAAALAARTDIRSRLSRSVARASSRIADQAARARVVAADATRRPVPVAVTTAAATALVVAVVLARRARR